MSGSTFEVDLGTISLATGGESERFDVYVLTRAAIQAVWAGADAVDGTIRVQESVDGQIWFCASNESTIDAAIGAKLWKFESLTTRFIRVSVNKGSNTAGTVYIQAIGKP